MIDGIEADDVLRRDSALQQIVSNTELDGDTGKERELLDGKIKAVELSGRKRYFELRDKWSGWIIRWITTLILFNIIITLAVGYKILDYSEYEWFITAVIVQTFLQIVGLGAIAVRYLFKDN